MFRAISLRHHSAQRVPQQEKRGLPVSNCPRSRGMPNAVRHRALRLVRRMRLLLALLALAALADSPSPSTSDKSDDAAADAWSVDAPHGPVHEVPLDLREGTWMDVTVHGDRLVFSLLGDLWSMP